MSSPTSSWESVLLSRAYEALDNHTPAGSFILDVEACDRINLLKQAYQHCETITKVHSRTFFLASGLLSEAKRHAARALYAFCRFSDDLVDRAVSAPQIALEAWRQRAMSPCPPEDDLVALAWADTRARYEIPRLYAEQLIEGVARDLTKMRYNTFHELAEYAYGVASTVGLMAMHIIGFSGPEAVPYAIRLGVALQLTNILRDVGEDWRSGRLYIPQDELAAFGLTEADIAAGRVDDRWRALMRFQIERNRRLYAESMPGIGLLHSDGRFAIAAAAELYRAILEDIEAHDMDVFNRRAQVSQLGKLRRLLGIWTRARRAHPAQATIA